MLSAAEWQLGCVLGHINQVVIQPSLFFLHCIDYFSINKTILYSDSENLHFLIMCLIIDATLVIFYCLVERKENLLYVMLERGFSHFEIEKN